MKIRIRFFAVLRERTGTPEVIKEVPDGLTIGQLWESVRQDYPEVSRGRLRLLYAVNQNYVGADYVLNDQDEVVFIPPVSGGR